MIGIERLKQALSSSVSFSFQKETLEERSFLPLMVLLTILGAAIIGLRLSDLQHEIWHPLLITALGLLSLGGVVGFVAWSCGFLMLPFLQTQKKPVGLSTESGGAQIDNTQEKTLLLPRVSACGSMSDIAFFDNDAIAIATLTAEGRIIKTNKMFRAALQGQDKRLDFYALALWDLVIPQERETLSLKIKELKDSDSESLIIDLKIESAPDRSVRFYIAALPINNAESGEDYWIVYAIDTTEQRVLETHFFHIQKLQAVGQLAGGLAHDFNNVLQAIIGYSDLLLGHHKPTDPSFQDIMHIKQNANRAAGLVRQLLAFSRQQTLRPQVLQLVEVLSDLAPLFKRLLGECITLDMRHGRNLWSIKADLTNFEQVMINLVVNARDAMPSGGKLSIRTANILPEDIKSYHYAELSEDEYVLIEVIDEGIGIPPELLNKVFEPFFTTKEVGKGTGLGLATVYGIVKQTGGFVFCDSVVNEGTRFHIFLPRYRANEDPIPIAPSFALHPLADLTGRGCILLVEDEESVRSFAARALISRGYTVLQAGSGCEALDIIEQQGPGIDLVISDVMMPEMDGPTLFRELQKSHQDLRMVFISGYAEEAFRKNFSEKEKFTLLLKPFTLKQLVETVKTVLG